MSLLTIVQSACLRVGVPKPTAVFTATDATSQQMQELLNEEGQTLSEMYEWQALRAEATFTTVATETQVALATAAPGMKYIVNDTIWDRTLRRPVFGPLNAQRWQQLKAINMVGPWYQFRIVNNNIIFIPVPSAGDACYFEYQSKNWVTTGSGSSDVWTADTDTAKLDESIMTMGLIWRFKAAKGFDYEEDKEKWQRRLINQMAADGTKDFLNLGQGHYEIAPAIVVPAGNWGV